ncbi:hypothetical protein HII36_22790, partial [Nonomuraea sp. NN258]|uniref:hypothetical protein n=1 Tax=Nonomuraea antri TaxID=2730852 RepID=UPI001C2BE386
GWAGWFARELVPHGPLHQGRWTIGPDAPCLARSPGRAPGPQWARLLADGHPEGYLGWIPSGSGQVVPLRPLPGPGDAEVTSYRAAARAGTLPPVLLWWISGLDAYVVLDGHDRLAAALAEAVEPPLLALHRAAAASESAAGSSVASLEREVINQAVGARQALARRYQGLSDRPAEPPAGPERTRAWPMPGGLAAWNRHAAGWTAAGPR